MKKNKLSIESCLNDSDDSLHFKNPILKRKPVKPSSPHRKRVKVDKKSEILPKTSTSVRSESRKMSDTNRGTNEPLRPLAVEVVFPKQSESVDADDSNKPIEQAATTSAYINSSSSKEGLAAASDKMLESIQEKPDPACKISGILNTQSVDEEPCNEVIVPPFDITSGSVPTQPALGPLVCPLCPKTFDNKSAHLSHMKQCAKKKKMSTTELLEAIEWRKNNLAPTSTFKKNNFPAKKRRIPDNVGPASDELSVAIAMSMSVSSSCKPSNIDKSVVDLQRVTLERFGFTTTSTTIPSGARRGKNQARKSSILRSRTAEERLKLLTEKAAVILLSEEVECPTRPKKVQNFELEEPMQYQATVPTLWKLCESEADGPWHLATLNQNLEPELLNSKRLSIDSVSTVEMDNQDLLNIDESLERNPSESASNAFEVNRTEAFGDNDLIESELVTDEDLSPVIAKIILPINTISQDWATMVNNEMGSDITIITKNGLLHLHSLVLQVRCPKFFEVDYRGVFRTVPSSSALVFLNFIYTGTIGMFKRADLGYVTLLAEYFNITPLITITAAMSAILNGSGSIDDVYIPNTPKSQQIGAGNCEATTVKMAVDSPAVNKLSPKPADEADTLPVDALSMSVDDVSIIPRDEFRRVSELVDLTGNLSPESCNDDIEPAETSYWGVLGERQHNVEEIRRQREQAVLESIERVQEMEKIASFIQSQKERNQSLADDLEKEELHESQLEREKIFRLSRSSEKDLFEDLEEIEEVPLLQPNLPPEEVIIVSSDEDKNDFDVSTDDDNTELVKKSECFTLPPFDPPHDPPEFDDLLDYFPSEGVIAMSPLKSQSLVKSAASPRTPKRVLGKTLSPVNVPVGSSTPVENGEERNLRKDYPVTPKPCSSKALHEVSNHQADSSSETSRHSVEITSGMRRKRQSLAQRMGKKIVNRSKRSLQSRKSSRRSLREIRTEDVGVEAALSSSLIQGLNETWAETPERVRPFVEITPRQTPSLKLSDKVTPKPNYSAMRTASIKRHLQKYGLKKSLGKTKAKKILHHIYNELHPIVNTKTGKFVRYLDDTDGKKKKNVKQRKHANAEAGTGNKRRGALKPRSKSATISDKSRLIVTGTELSLRQGSILHDNASTVPTNPSSEVPQTSSSKLCGSGLDLLSKDTSLDLVNSFSSEASDESQSDESEEEFADIEDEILTQQTGSRMPVEEAVITYIKETTQLHRLVLLYQPIWVEEIQRGIRTSYGAKYKLIDIMDFLDKKCITFRSETQAASNMKRNLRKKKRLSPKKKE